MRVLFRVNTAHLARGLVRGYKDVCLVLVKAIMYLQPPPAFDPTVILLFAAVVALIFIPTCLCLVMILMKKNNPDLGRRVSVDSHLGSNSTITPCASIISQTPSGDETLVNLG